jgi:hypothetical protein
VVGNASPSIGGRLALVAGETETPSHRRRTSPGQPNSTVPRRYTKLLNQHNLDAVFTILNPRFRDNSMLRLVKATLVKDSHQNSGGV